MTMVEMLGVGGTLIYGLRVALIGMLVVFVGLIILIIMIEFISLLIRQNEERLTHAAKEAAQLPETAGAEDDELVAVIAAVLAAMEFKESEVPVISRIAEQHSVRSMRNRPGMMEFHEKTAVG